MFYFKSISSSMGYCKYGDSCHKLHPTDFSNKRAIFCIGEDDYDLEYSKGVIVKEKFDQNEFIIRLDNELPKNFCNFDTKYVKPIQDGLYEISSYNVERFL
jgi:hypothetical protein